VATIESIGSSTRIEGSKLSDREVEKLLSNLEVKSFDTRDAQEVAGYAETIELIFPSWGEITLTENHVKQLHRDLLKYSEKDAHHRGEYKTQSNSVAAFDETGKEIGIVFETATQFDTAPDDGIPRLGEGGWRPGNCILCWSPPSSLGYSSKSIPSKMATAG
jgi:Fic family protein